jgi:hypothetical protein
MKQEMLSMTENAWTELLDHMRRSVSALAAEKPAPHGESPFQWSAPKKVILYPVQMRLEGVSHGYSITFERAMAEAGSVNYEALPGAPEPLREIIQLHLDESGGEPFWRLSERSAPGMPMKTDVLVRRLLERLQVFRNEYRLAMLR